MTKNHALVRVHKVNPYHVSRAGSGLFVWQCHICKASNNGFDRMPNARTQAQEHVLANHYRLVAIVGHCVSADGDYWHKPKSCTCQDKHAPCCYYEYRNGEHAEKYCDFVNFNRRPVR